jgi:hypothetical protein
MTVDANTLLSAGLAAPSTDSGEGALRRSVQKWRREDDDASQMASVETEVASLLPFVLALARLAASRDSERPHPHTSSCDS